MVGIRLLDNVLDHSNYPLRRQAEEATMKRRVGLGITGLADALIMCGVRYGSVEAQKLTHHWLKIFQEASYLSSSEIASEKGAFPLYNEKEYLSAKVFKNINSEIKATIRKKGIRNGALNSVAQLLQELYRYMLEIYLQVLNLSIALK